MATFHIDLDRYELPEISHQNGFPFVVVGFEAAKKAAAEFGVDAIWLVDDNVFAPGFICVFALQNGAWVRQF